MGTTWDNTIAKDRTNKSYLTWKEMKMVMLQKKRRRLVDVEETAEVSPNATSVPIDI